MRVLFLGPPGAGKGTQSQLIHDTTGVPVLVMGDMLRESVRQGDEVGKQAESYMKNGVLVPDDVVIQVILNRLQDSDCQEKGFMLDGFPRNSNQAKALDQHLAQYGLELDTVLYYAIANEVVIERISRRYNCRGCSAVFRKDGDDKILGSHKKECRGIEYYQRHDDTAEVVSKRLVEYDEKTAPLLEYYREQGILVEISANRAIEQVLEESLRHLQKLN